MRCAIPQACLKIAYSILLESAKIDALRDASSVYKTRITYVALMALRIWWGAVNSGPVDDRPVQVSQWLCVLVCLGTCHRGTWTGVRHRWGSVKSQLPFRDDIISNQFQWTCLQSILPLEVNPSRISANEKEIVSNSLTHSRGTSWQRGLLLKEMRQNKPKTEVKWRKLSSGWWELIYKRRSIFHQPYHP